MMAWKHHSQLISKQKYIPDVIVIEAEHTLRRLYKDALSLIGLEISHEFRTSTEFLDEYKFDEPRIFIQHHTYFGMNGFDLLKYIKERDSLSYIIILTAHHNTKNQYMKLGADCWLEKPCKMSDFFEVLVRACEIINERLSTSSYEFNDTKFG